MSEVWHEGLEKPDELNADGCIALVCAVVLQAVTSWRIARKKLKRKPWDSGYRARMAAVEHFLLSDWFESLSGLDGAALLEKLEREG